MFPITRLSRLRRSSFLRDMIAETNLRIDDFIYPVFVEEEIEDNVPISSMPGQYRIAEKNLTTHIQNLYKQNVRAVIIFVVSHHKDENGAISLVKQSSLARIINKAKMAQSEMFVICDNCFCAYTNHGHCGLLKDNFIDNDASIELLAKQSIICAQAGCDMIAPSAMLDGQIMAIRQALDSENFTHIPIMSYAVKYASSFYGPFRNAANSALAHGDRKTHQMDIRNAKEGLREATEDQKEGADILMVKPAGLYLDIIAKLSEKINLPIAAYQVSGEYSSIKFAAQANILDEPQAIIESLTAIKRAGASIIISYFTPQIIQLIN